MYDLEESIVHYQRLIELMEEDMADISLCIQGELLDEYREVVEREMDILKNTIRLTN